jgi:hypothetical protein
MVARDYQCVQMFAHLDKTMIPRSTIPIRTAALEKVREACRLTGVKVTDFVSMAASDKANDVIAEHGRSQAGSINLVPSGRKARKRTHIQAKS